MSTGLRETTWRGTCLAWRWGAPRLWLMSLAFDCGVDLMFLSQKKHWFKIELEVEVVGLDINVRAFQIAIGVRKRT